MQYDIRSFNISYPWWNEYENRIEFENYKANYNSSINITISPASLFNTCRSYRLHNFNNLPKSKNSENYYQRNDNIISEEYSGINDKIFKEIVFLLTIILHKKITNLFH